MKLLRKSLMTIPLNNFTRQVKHILLSIDMGKFWSQKILKISDKWYPPDILCHPGKTKTKINISQHFYWKGIQKSLHNLYSKCHTCQFLKVGKWNYGKLPTKQAENQPSDMLCMDLIGKYRMAPNFVIGRCKSKAN